MRLICAMCGYLRPCVWIRPADKEVVKTHSVCATCLKEAYDLAKEVTDEYDEKCLYNRVLRRV